MGLQRYLSGNLAKKVGWSKETASSLIFWKSFKKSNLFTKKLLVRPRYSFGFSSSPLRLPGRLSGSLGEVKVTWLCPTLCESMDCTVHEFSRPEYWSGELFPSPGNLPNPGIQSRSLALQTDSLPAEPPGKCMDPSHHCIAQIQHAGVLLLFFSLSVMPHSLQHHKLQHARLPCPSPSPGVSSNSCLLSWWCHPTTSSSVTPFLPALSLSQHPGLSQWVSFSHQVTKLDV